MRFSEIPHHTETKNLLIGAVKKGTVPHALLFDGKSGGAALPLALAFATYVNCTKTVEGDSCGNCSSCRQYDKLSHPDLTFTFPTAGGKKVLSENFMTEWREFLTENPFGTYSDWLFYIKIKQGNIPVEESRKIIQNLSYTSYQGSYKVVLVWNVEYMAAPAANALLKILEEPPQKTLFLLVTSNYSRLLPTIQSRVQRVAVPELQPDELATFLVSKYHQTEDQAHKAAFLADGNINRGIRIGETSDSDYKSLFAAWMRYCYAFDLSKIVPLADTFDKFSKEEQKQILEYGLGILREIYLESIGVQNLIKLEGEELVFVQKFSKVFKFENLGKITALISEAILHIERNARAKIIFLDLSLSIVGLIR